MKTLDPQGFMEKIFYKQSEEAAKIANQNGYFLLSYDERGWDDSGGTDELMSPDYNGKDFKAILDWAESNLGPQLARRNGQLVVGTLGYSYGGVYQLLASSVDNRVAAMVPALTWHAFMSGIARGLPTYQPKVSWLKLLNTAGKAFSNPNPTFIQANSDIAKNGDASTYLPALADLVKGNGANAYCDEGVTPAPGQTRPNIPTWLVQGWQDSLLTPNEAYETAKCLRNQANNDVRVLIQQYGHSLPFTVKFPPGDGLIAIGMEENPTCGGVTFNLPQAMYSFIDENIRGAQRSGPHVDVPVNCVTVDDNTGFVVDALPTTGSSYTVQTQTVSGTGSKATFVPLYTATGSKATAGIPHMNVTITSSNNAPWAYFGIGIKRAGSRQFELLDNQAFPIHGKGSFDTDMIGVSANLAKGDVVGIYASNKESMFSYSAQPSMMPAYSFSGTFTLPEFLN
jgi:pimeloyl-ACP methyl ester carboxylesterase